MSPISEGFSFPVSKISRNFLLNHFFSDFFFRIYQLLCDKMRTFCKLLKNWNRMNPVFHDLFLSKCHTIKPRRREVSMSSCHLPQYARFSTTFTHLVLADTRISSRQLIEFVPVLYEKGWVTTYRAEFFILRRAHVINLPQIQNRFTGNFSRLFWTNNSVQFLPILLWVMNLFEGVHNLY